MRIVAALLLIFYFVSVPPAFSQTGESNPAKSDSSKLSILVIPYNPMMHMSDADYDISEYSEKQIAEVRSIFRQRLVQNINAKLITVYDMKVPERDFVQKDVDDLELLYHSLYYGKDTIYPVKYPKKDSTLLVKKIFQKKDKSVKPMDKTYINVGVYDQKLLTDLAKKYDVDLFVFLNEFDINTDYTDCLNLALKIYQRNLKVHYSVFDRNGKQVYGDVAVSQFPSNSNNIDEITNSNFPFISDYIKESLRFQ